MLNPRNNWYVLTGGPSTGKTSIVEALKKNGHRTVEEAARTVIDRAGEKGIPASELRKDEKWFQEEVTRLKRDTHKKLLHTDEPVFFDRGMHDTIAYLKHYDFTVEEWVTELMKQHSYRTVFLLEPLDVFESDYARTEDESFVKEIHGLLHDAYAIYGMQPILVPKMSLEERMQFILSHIESES